jgi:predicted nucleic acid-binding Zn finger protein
MKEIIERHEVFSYSNDSKYIVSKCDDGSWACSCPSWKFSKGHKVICKHIKEVMFKQQTTTLDISGIAKVNEVEEIKNG